MQLLLILIAISIAIAGLFLFWRRHVMSEIQEGAQYEWDVLQRNDPRLVEGVSEDDFEDIYAHSKFPRAPGYILVLIILAILGSPIVLALLSGGVYMMESMGVFQEGLDHSRRVVIEDGVIRSFNGGDVTALRSWLHDISGFYYFFGLLFYWVAMVYIVMRHYHKTNPGHLRDEILRHKADELY